MIINKKIKRTMLESKSQYIGSLVLIVFSCLLFIMFNLVSRNLTKLSSSFEKDYKQEDASFIATPRINNIEGLETKFNMSIEETKSFDYLLSEDKTLRIFSENKKVNIRFLIMFLINKSLLSSYESHWNKFSLKLCYKAAQLNTFLLPRLLFTSQNIYIYYIRILLMMLNPNIYS